MALKAIRWGLFWSVAFITASALFIYREGSLNTYYGFSEFEQTGLMGRPVLLAMSCLVGILSKALYDEIITASEYNPLPILQRAFAPQRVAKSVLIAPIVILSAYGKIDEIRDVLMLGLFLVPDRLLLSDRY